MSAELKKSKPKSKEYPAVTLGQAIEFVGKFKDYPRGKPISYDVAAKECGVSSSTKSFRYTISSAKQFGLISTSTGLTFTLLEPAYRLVRPTESEAALRTLKIECFSTPKLYAEMLPDLIGKSLPSVSTIENLLVNYHQILPTTAKNAAQKFVDSATELNIIQNGVLCLDTESNSNFPTEINAENSEGNNTEIQNRSTIGGTPVVDAKEFAAPLNIPFGDKRKAVLYMPMDTTKEDAEYVKEMIALMFKRVYKVD